MITYSYNPLEKNTTLSSRKEPVESTIQGSHDSNAPSVLSYSTITD